MMNNYANLGEVMVSTIRINNGLLKELINNNEDCIKIRRGRNFLDEIYRY